MKNLDPSIKRVLSIAISFGIVLCSISLLLFSLATIPKTYADPNKKDEVMQAPIIISGYQIIGFDEKTHSAVGFKKDNLTNDRIREFK